MQPDIGLFFQAKQLHFRGRTLLCMDSHRPRASMYKKKINKVIGTRGQGVRVWCPRELTPEHLTEPSLRLD